MSVSARTAHPLTDALDERRHVPEVDTESAVECLVGLMAEVFEPVHRSSLDR